MCDEDRPDECVSSPLECVCGNSCDLTRIVTDPNAEIPEYFLIVTEQDSENGVDVPIVDEDGGRVGLLKFPPGVLPEGCLLRISSPSDEDLEKSLPEISEDEPGLFGCGTSKKTTFERASASFSVELLPFISSDCELQGRAIVRLFVNGTLEQENFCLGFTDGDNDDWDCEGGNTKAASEDDTTFVEGSTNHFTTFAALLANGNSENECGDVPFWWGHIIAMSVCWFLAIVFIYLANHNRYGQKLVYGKEFGAFEKKIASLSRQSAGPDG